MCPANPSTIPIRVQGLKKSYSSGFFRKKRNDALRGVSFDVPRGQVFGLLGPNGAGKTTIIKILLGIVKPSGGSAELLGHAAGKQVSRKRVGYLPENLQLANHHNAESALEYFGRLSGMDRSDIRKRGGELIERVGLDRRKKESVKNYSKGMRQRLGLAQALLHEPELLVMDEPTDGLDPVGRTQVRDILKDFGERGNTVFLNSHLLQEVEMICDHVAILAKGELKFAGALSEFQTSENTQLDLLVHCQESTVREALASFELDHCNSTSNQRTKVTLRVNDQGEINSIVDSLRANEISIESFAPRRRTLEDIFLEVVRGPYQA